MAGEVDKREFVNKVGQFYVGYFDSLANAVEILAEIQEKFPSKYKLLQEATRDPQTLLKLFETMSPDQKLGLFDLIVKSGQLQQKISGIHGMESKELLRFSYELKEFARHCKSILEKSIERQEGKK